MLASLSILDLFIELEAGEQSRGFWHSNLWLHKLYCNKKGYPTQLV